MSFRRFIIALGLAAAVLSCKKEEETSITPSLDGYLIIERLPEFASEGQTCSLDVKGVSHPDGGEIGYYWKVVPSAPQACTTKTFNFTFTDTLQTVSIYCYAYAEGYSGSSAIASVTIVKGGINGSITGIEYPSENVTTEDGTYFYKQIGTQTWTLNNLAEKSSGTGAAIGTGYRNYDVMSDVFGRYYNYNDAVAACESIGEGWYLPTLDDWNVLKEYISGQTGEVAGYGKSVTAAMMGNAAFNTQTMWEYWPSVGDMTNASGFSAIPAGYANIKSGQFVGVHEYTAFWTKTPVEGSEKEAYCVYMVCDQPDLFNGGRDKESFGASVRCIKK